ncbi:glucose-1-phosphate adenylyltransferase [Halanaerobium congolense]|jgi:glucose-1-phosphate adenylyltransferase|uniref:Glucose-1-phosphate adenylyltransferase n=1 Tax=Halanaerobium congolense TaxID=54121 RepID=A0A1I0BHP0_9FIRM|nr:glucose-1-phosphate adenylyltransferase [Halanaerobium congolense]PTX16654.1 glucose-1-phosphate adenylyltransferase [Halanaerobium congolense]SDF74491.1 glucose-1-phosphate adenylyltransferase [Halanaerobium congolense]SDH70857.1 glucose-1-phosphate adenylyltransferase [Halanaerobium congolense]SET06483.1 glucose-1-phosphate adenylyltransferase [Halanaerobium congolense]SFP47189.1 glucose-1-phosphate adenylyltransferase [Halanaerobium congolense]
MPKEEMIAMLLAGGKGTRLGVLTRDIAKPAVPFGAEYRLIDFPLSNCSNSGINTVGVLTQYKPLILNSYIGSGSSWDLDRHNGGVTVLPPYVKEGGGSWYKGTADAIYQNIEFIDIHDPEYVLVLSGDHIYKMDYSEMLNYHKNKNADVTIGVLEVPWEETHRFGIMNTNQDQKIIEFQEKPENAKNNLASMGIYIFNWEYLKKYLEAEAEANDDSAGDFGHDIIPEMMADELNFYAYTFKDYWKDVGTVESYWQAHMDLLGENPELDLQDRNWIIYSVNPNRPPQYLSEDAVVDNSMINKGTQIMGTVKNSVLFFGVKVARDAVVEDSVILPNTRIRSGAKIKNSIVGRNVIIEKDSQIGLENEDQDLKITVIGDDEVIPEASNIKAGMVVG